MGKSTISMAIFNSYVKLLVIYPLNLVIFPFVYVNELTESPRVA